MALANRSLQALSEPDRRLLESWLTDFDLRWQAGCLASAVGRLPPVHPLRLMALVEMVKIDLERHWQGGNPLLVEDYLADYPELGTADTAPTELLLAEWEVRQELTGAPDLAAFGQRFPRQASSLRKALANEPATRPGSRETDSPADPTPSVASPRTLAGPLPEQFGRYRIIKVLGQGGMGTVYLARDTQLDRPVALKVPRFSPQDGPEVLERFYREARLAATLDHPNICPIHDVGAIDGTHYLTMACIPGKPLSGLVRAGQPFSPTRAASLVRKLALALAAAHARGVVHRDLKPANVLIKPGGEPVVTDFGLARGIVYPEDPRLTPSGLPLGTPAYMSPEQVRGDLLAMGVGCDIYSLGVILYELLTGRLPFDGNVAEVLCDILTRAPAAPSRLRPGVDPQLEGICLKALAKQPADRYPSMTAFAEALANYLGSNRQAPASARPAAASPRLCARRSTRFSGLPAWVWIAGGIASFLLLFGIIAGVLLYGQRRAGALVLTFSEPRAAVVVLLDDKRVDASASRFPLAPGDHTLEVTSTEFDRVEQHFVIRPGEDEPILVRLVRRSATETDPVESPTDLVLPEKDVPAPLDTAVWRELEPADARFHVELPGVPTRKAEPLESPVGKLDYVQYECLSTAQDMHLLVSYIDYPESLIRAGIPQTLLNGARDGAVEKANGKLLHEESIKLGKYPGRALLVEAADGRAYLRARMYLVGTRFFLLMASGPTRNAVASAEVDRFFQSFRLLP